MRAHGFAAPPPLLCVLGSAHGSCVLASRVQKRTRYTSFPSQRWCTFSQSYESSMQLIWLVGTQSFAAVGGLEPVSPQSHPLS